MLKSILRSIGTVVLPPLGYVLMRFYWHTCTKKFYIDGNVTDGQCIVVCWHGELFMSPQAYRHIHKDAKASGIISRHFDGEMIARILQFFHISPLRGSSSRGAKQVLLEAFRALKNGDDLLVTPDGPRGPRHHISDGAVALAHKAKAPVLIVNYTASSYWQLQSWDRFVIPKPFSRIDFYIKYLAFDGLDFEASKTLLRETMLADTIV